MSTITTSVASPVKMQIAGTIDLAAIGTPEKTHVTPSGRCHFFEWPVRGAFNGDVTGPVTFHEDNQAPCDLSDLVGSGPIDGQVTWNGRTGAISGQWTTNCNPDPTQPVGLSCDGVMNARGAGDLDGVQFHFVWGPGWWPFNYSGSAFSH